MAHRLSCQHRSLLLLAGVACLALLSTAQAASGRALLGKKGPAPSPSPIPADARKGMGWVSDQFTLVRKTKCDATFYHSSLVLNITRPDRWTVCFDISTMAPNGKYACHAAPTAGQVDTVQVLSTAACAKSIDTVTVDGKAWEEYAWVKATNILSINKLASAPLVGSKPFVHTVCVGLDATADACNSLNEFCAPTYGPDANACGVLISDAVSTTTGEPSCCPVYRSSFGAAPIQAAYTFRVSGRFTGTGMNCGLVNKNENISAQFEQAIVTAYGKALSMQPAQFQVVNTDCRVKSFEAIIKMTGLTDPDAVVKSSSTYLRSIAKTLGFEKVRAVPYVPSPPSPPKPKRSPSPAPSPSPKTQGFNETQVPTPTPAPKPAPSPAVNGPSPAPAPTPVPSPAVSGPSPAPAPTPVPSPAVNGPSPVPAPTPVPSPAVDGPSPAPAPTPVPSPAVNGPSPSPSPAAGPSPTPSPSPAVYPIVPLANQPPSPAPSYGGASPSPSQQQGPAPSYGG
ncbi:hypothetical protein HYH02_008108 [Chlamydomonas schloesseri]|uniref:Pherophorin domain-containing protein n=1 Tax=Chlamydomonas schloesseri TaxID=2026947 RepID=A0A835WG43_9CHLO|nr:hypothetical protein HYH02_008108 [Chlamydomonas schloesseri]|eukprot:KAG2446954.1 hypothetical protein HYH02_008108 [Chlamydomonas schloesseri]